MTEAKTNEGDDLNADAIYTAMCWMRGYLNTPEGQAEAAILTARGEVSRWSLTSGTGEAIGGSNPDFDDFDQDQCNEIYPGEHMSVQVGRFLAVKYLYGGEDFAAFIADHHPYDCPTAVALRRFMADPKQGH
jgi:hypothetical protein